ncbi:MAG TPA: hypothetical protein VH255_10625 [Verrucomicrobiae bacterium]|jgi:hypothetical protein|nr:hypothetical protein [Verrucomicrobiae bacterium]
MTVEEALKHVKKCADTMNSRYGSTVFDEWAIISLLHNKGRILAYIGPRNDDFLQNFAHDIGSLRAGLMTGDYNIGDFEFSRHAIGTRFEAFMVMGVGLYLICNNTRSSMDEIAKDPRWLNAQVAFAELSETVRAKPLAGSHENTAFLKKTL